MGASDLSFSAQDLGDGNFSFTWDDLYIDKSGSPEASFGGDLLKVSLGADYVLKGGLIATVQGDLGDADLSYDIDIPEFGSKAQDGNAVIDTSGWSVKSGSLSVTSFDPAAFRASADISADIELALEGSISSHLSIQKDAEYLKTKNPFYNPAEWIEETLKTKNPFYDPNEWIIVDLGLFTVKTKNPLYNPNEWIIETLKTKNPLYDPNEWIITQITPEVNIETDIIPKQGFSTGKIIDIETSKNLFSLDASKTEPYTFNFDYGEISAKLPSQIIASSSQLVPDGDQLPNLVTFGSTPLLSASLDVLKLVASAFGIPPGAFSGEKGFNIGDNINFAVDYSLLEALATANVNVGQRTEFTPKNVSVTMTASTGEIKTGVLGDEFKFTTPTSGTGEFTVDATYNLEGSIKTEIGLVTQGSFDLKGLAFGVKADLAANILGFEVDEHWDKDLIGPLVNESYELGEMSDLIVLYSEVSEYKLPSIYKRYKVKYINGDVVVSNTDQGYNPETSTVTSLSTYTLQSTESNLVLDGLLNINGIGNGLDNLLVGNTGRNILSGAGGNDKLFGGKGLDYLRGGRGNDELSGGRDRDKLTGNAGKDRFVFDDKDTGASRKTADYIQDFHGSRGDKLDLRPMDANSKTSADNKFKFIGEKDAFSGVGQVRYETTAKDTYIYINTDRDSSAEAVIRLKGEMDFHKGWLLA